MKTYSEIILILLIIFLTLGMGSFDVGSSPGRIPMPDKKYKATFIDQMDVATDCNNASIEGNTFIEGKMGSGSHTVAFDQIHEILFHRNGDALKGILNLSDGGTMKLTINKDSKAFGTTRHGTFQIKVIDLKKMIIVGAVK